MARCRSSSSTFSSSSSSGSLIALVVQSWFTWLSKDSSMSAKSLWGGRLLPLPVVVDEGVLHDLEQPGLEVGAFLELVVVLVGFEVGLLHQIFRILGVAGHAVRGVVEGVHERHGGRSRSSSPDRGSRTRVCIIGSSSDRSYPSSPLKVRTSGANGSMSLRGPRNGRCRAAASSRGTDRRPRMPTWRPPATGLGFPGPGPLSSAVPQPPVSARGGGRLRLHGLLQSAAKCLRNRHFPRRAGSPT